MTGFNQQNVVETIFYKFELRRPEALQLLLFSSWNKPKVASLMMRNHMEREAAGTRKPAHIM